MSCDAKIVERCSYCGSMSVEKAIQLLKTPGTTFSGCDWKYGWPHKFYIGGGKFYNGHLATVSEDQLKEFAALSESAFRIGFSRDAGGVKWTAPPTDNSSYGFQMFGVIGADGKPNHSRMVDIEAVATRNRQANESNP